MGVGAADEEIAELVGAAWGLEASPRDEVAECLERLRTEGVVG